MKQLQALLASSRIRPHDVFVVATCFKSGLTPQAKQVNHYCLQQMYDYVAYSNIPSVVVGDFNQGIRKIDPFLAYSSLGCEEMFRFHRNVCGHDLPPTCAEPIWPKKRRKKMCFASTTPAGKFRLTREFADASPQRTVYRTVTSRQSTEDASDHTQLCDILGKNYADEAVVTIIQKIQVLGSRKMESNTK